MKYVYIAAGIAWFWLLGMQTETEPMVIQVINIIALLTIAGAAIGGEMAHRNKN